MSRAKFQDKIDNDLREVGDNLKELEIILKKEGKKEPIKEKAKNLLQQTYELLVARSSGQYIDQEELKTNKNKLKELDEILLEKNQRDEPTEHRELYQEEKDKMNSWNDRVGQQDRKLDNIGIGVKELAVKSKKIGEQTDQMGRVINDVQKDADKVHKNLETTNAKLKKLLNNLRSGDKICIDIILVLICLGLIAVLYNLIQTKFINNKSSSNNSGTANTRFLVIMLD
jgi:methyl-accepting chemotaxis protein